jgi:hypothetical protein
LEALKTATGSFTPALLVATGLMVISILQIVQLKNPQFSRNKTPKEN